MNGQSVVNYTYDAWGEITSISGLMTDTIGNLNPMRYCSYYYDNESGYYYLQSRYYDSNTCRFINADEPVLLQITQGQLPITNLFEYSENNPIMNIDPTGYYSVAAEAKWLINSLFTSTKIQAYSLAKVAGGFKEPMQHKKHKKVIGFYNHFHISGHANGAHIWYLFQ